MYSAANVFPPTNMLFNNYIFYYFFVLILIVNFIIPPKKRWISLLIFNLIFLYFIDFSFVFIFISLAIINFQSFKWIKKYKAAKIGLIVLNLSTLFVFKYLKILVPGDSLISSIILPVGISYFVFEQVSFLVDSYKLDKCEYHLGHYLCSSLFLGKISSGPIERPLFFTKGFIEIENLTAKEIRLAVLLIFWG